MRFDRALMSGLAAWMLVAGGCAASSARAQRSVLFDDGWKFQKGEVTGAEAVGFKDSEWRSVQLPHDWGIEGPFSQEWASGQGFLPGGIGWYRKSFELPADGSGKMVMVQFDGVYKHSQVWCNGKLAGGRPYGYMSFIVDLTPFVKVGEKNEIAVRVDHSDFADSRWYTGSGIFRDVHLVMTDKVRVDGWGTFVTTPKVMADEALVVVETKVRNDSGKDANVSLVSVIEDANGKEVGRAEDQRNTRDASMEMFEQKVVVKQPTMWSVEKPAMYRVKSEVKVGGKVVDAYDTPFGIRSFAFDAEKGFTLNGQSLKLKGVCLHEDAGALGAAIPIQVWQRRLGLLKEAGCNAIRTSHNPPAPEFLDLCDTMGFLVMDEAFDEWTRGKNKWVAGRNQGRASKAGYNTDFAQWSDTDIKDMVRRDRNHPSIIMWSIGNEIDYLNDPFPANSPELPPVAAKLIAAVKSEDKTRPVTAACAAVGTNLWVDQLDIAGYNYQETRYPMDHAANPKRVIYGSENSQNYNAWAAVAQNNYIAGQFLWTGIDYLGEAGSWPNRGSAAGIMDLAGFPKARFYQRQAWWSDKPIVHLEVNARGVTCYSNCERVALFHDGTLVGEDAVPANGQVNRTLAFTSGTLKAVGKKGGVEVCTFEMQAPGTAKKVVLLPDVKSLKGDGRDVAQIEVNVADAAGHRVPDGTQVINFTLAGPGRILGIESGNQSSHESYQAPTHKAVGGRLMVYVQTVKGVGEITLTASAEGLEAGKATISVK